MIDDEKIIEMFFKRSEQGIRELDIKYGKVCHNLSYHIGVSLGLSMNFEAVTARYVDVRLERKKEVLDAYHGAVKQADPAKAEKAEPKKAKSAAKKKSSDLEL